MVKPDKSRYVYLYLPSAEEKARWEKLAKEAGVPLSKFVIEIVDNALADETEIRPRGELIKEIGSLRQDNSRLREELKLKSTLTGVSETGSTEVVSWLFSLSGFRHADIDQVIDALVR